MILDFIYISVPPRTDKSHNVSLFLMTRHNKLALGGKNYTSKSDNMSTGKILAFKRLLTEMLS